MSVKIIETEEELNLLLEQHKNQPMLVDFYADWCGPCKMLSPILDQVKDYPTFKINVDNNPELASKFGVLSLPSLLFFKDGEEQDRNCGFLPLPMILDKLDKIK